MAVTAAADATTAATATTICLDKMKKKRDRASDGESTQRHSAAERWAEGDLFSVFAFQFFAKNFTSGCDENESTNDKFNSIQYATRRERVRRRRENRQANRQALCVRLKKSQYILERTNTREKEKEEEKKTKSGE